MRVTIRCEYPGSNLEPTEVRFTPGPELGATAEEVHDTIRGLLLAVRYFELPVSGGEPPLPFSTDTVRSVRVEEAP